MSDKETQLKRAKSAMISHDYETATRIYKSLIQENASDIDLKVQLGNLYVKSGQDRKALKIFEEIDALRPNDVDALLALGGIYRRLNEFQKSIDSLEKAKDTGKKGALISYNLGFTYRQMGELDSAIQCFQDVIDENPRDVLAFNHLGAIFALQNDHEKAVATYQHGLKLDPNHPVLQFNMAKSMEALGEKAKAQSYYEGALRSKPGWPEAIDAYSDLLLKDDKVKEADDMVSRALEVNPDDVKMHTAMGRVYGRKSVYDQAEVEFKKALSRDGEYSPALTGLADSQSKQGKHSEAAATIEKASKLSPNDVSILKQTAQILLSANYLPAAYEKISHLWKTRQDDADVVNLLGQYYIVHGDSDKIESCFDKIEQIDPNYTDVYKDWGERFYQVGDEKNAEDYLKVAVHENPRDSSSMVKLANLYAIQGKSQDALDLLSQASRNDEHNVAVKKALDKMEKKVLSGKKGGNFDRENGIFDAPVQNPEAEKVEEIQEEEPAPLDSAEENPAEFQDSVDSDPAFSEEDLGDADDEIPYDVASSLDPLIDPDEGLDFGEKVDSEDEILPLADNDVEYFRKETVSAPKIEEPDDIVSIDNIVSKSKEEIGGGDELIDFDAPIDEEDAEDFESKRAPEQGRDSFFRSEEIGGKHEDTPLMLPADGNEDDDEWRNPAPRRKSDQRHQPKQISDDDYYSLERQIQRVANSADNAAYTANQAWRAAQFANDYAQNAEDKIRNAEKRLSRNMDEMLEDKFAEALDAKIEEKIREKIGDDLNAKISDTIDNFVTPPDTSIPEEETSEDVDKAVDDALTSLGFDVDSGEGGSVEDFAENGIESEDEESADSEAERMLRRAVEMLPSIVEAIENKTVEEEFSLSLDMFKKLREMLEFLPPAKKKQFMTSRTRLMLDYIIARLSGRPGLFATISALLNSGLITRSPTPTDEITSDLTIDASSEEDVVELVGSVFETLRGLCESLEDEYLRDALDTEILELLEKIKSA